MTAHEKALEAAARAYLRELDVDPDMPYGGRPGAKIWWTIEATTVAPAISAYLASMREQGWVMVDPEDYFGQLVLRARAAAGKASCKFPQPNYVALKIAEEAGEVIRVCVHYAENRMEWAEVESEIVQLLAIAMTRPKDIPSDILALARQTQDAAIKACDDEKLAVSDYPFASGHAKEVLDEHIARALLSYGQSRAEEAKERAARVCDEAATEADEHMAKVLTPDSKRNYASAHVTCKRLATAIRSRK